MIDAVLPRSCNLSAKPKDRLNCALADNDAATNMVAARGEFPPEAAPLPASPPLPKA